MLTAVPAQRCVLIFDVRRVSVFKAVPVELTVHAPIYPGLRPAPGVYSPPRELSHVRELY